MVCVIVHILCDVEFDMNTVNLNLARKWRSKNFDQIVGQDLSVRMLKNTLYLDHYFPVYLFSGQRGCGKTSTARVFAAALNCEKLSAFQEKPKTSKVPCLECTSCTAMMSANHPDFIEMDAASHTGVDNVRQIIDAASLLPLMGRKKVYLIDEAHMLSKAAFNAFLKILEEPPSSVLFILATTDPQKIIETVRSRCFQLFFKAVDAQPLLNHLEHVCKQERIAYEPEALQLIFKETDGSVRDALNILEQVRFSNSSVTAQAVLNVLGHLDDVSLLKLFEVLVSKGPKQLLAMVQKLNLTLFSPEFVWKKLIDITRAAIWLKYGVSAEHTAVYGATLKRLVRSTSIAQLNTMLELFYDNEQLFIRTTEKHSLLEMILLQLCKKNDSEGSSGVPPLAQKMSGSGEQLPDEDDDEYEDEQDDEEIEEEDDDVRDGTTPWQQFVSTISSLDDPLVSSLFQQGKVLTFDEKALSLQVEFPENFIFFKDWLDNTQTVWKPLLKKSFNQDIVFEPVFTGQHGKLPQARPVQKVPVVTKVEAQPAQQKQSYQKSGSTYRSAKRTTSRPVKLGPVVDVSDVATWQKANMLLNYFPGRITEIEKSA